MRFILKPGESDRAFAQRRVSWARRARHGRLYTRARRTATMQQMAFLAALVPTCSLVPMMMLGVALG